MKTNLDSLNQRLTPQTVVEPARSPLPGPRPLRAPAGDRATGWNPSNVIAIGTSIPAPLPLVYSQWTQFEAFPHFMQGVDEVPKRDEARMVWRIYFLGCDAPWEAEVCEQIPERRIAWRNVSGRPCPHHGSVCFEPADEDATRITIEMEFDLPSDLPADANPLYSVRALMHWSLERFQNFVGILMDRMGDARTEKRIIALV